MISETLSAEMLSLPGGRFWMGSDDHYPEERPAREVAVSPFSIDATPVTNRQFAEFVALTGYTTVAEEVPTIEDYPDADPDMLRAGSSVFVQPTGPVSHHDPFLWWEFKFGADWRHPYGPDSSLAGLEHHPVVHIAYRDAHAFARWMGKDLPTEAEWEFAARGGLDRAPYAWGDELHPAGRMMGNTWQGPFPHENDMTDGFLRTSPVGAFPPNGYGLYDMIGNVWEWTSDWYANGSQPARTCCVPRDPRGGDEAGSRETGAPGQHIGRKVLKGGSHLCAPNYCQRYRPAARYAQTIDSSTSHIGFRCVSRIGSSK